MQNWSMIHSEFTVTTFILRAG